MKSDTEDTVVVICVVNIFFQCAVYKAQLVGVALFDIFVFLFISIYVSLSLIILTALSNLSSPAESVRY